MLCCSYSHASVLVTAKWCLHIKDLKKGFVTTSYSALLHLAVAYTSCFAGPSHKNPLVLHLCVNTQI